MFRLHSFFHFEGHPLSQRFGPISPGFVRWRHFPGKDCQKFTISSDGLAALDGSECCRHADCEQIQNTSNVGFEDAPGTMAVTVPAFLWVVPTGWGDKYYTGG